MVVYANKDRPEIQDQILAGKNMSLNVALEKAIVINCTISRGNGRSGKRGADGLINSTSTR